MPPTVTEARIVAVYRETVDVLYGYASRKCGGERQLAEDVTQETWLRAVRDWRRTGVPDNPIGWLTTVARNLIINLARHQAPIRLDDVPPAVVSAALDGDSLGDDAEIVAVVNGALERMPADEARLLESFHFERCRVAQIAAEHGISERAVEGRLRRARERLRREIETTSRQAGGGIS